MLYGVRFQARWTYITSPVHLQELRRAHIDYKKQKVKVPLVTQVMSRSVADALMCCKNILRLSEFENSEGTSLFLMVFDLFDILNSRSNRARRFKKAMRAENFDALSSKLE